MGTSAALCPCPLGRVPGGGTACAPCLAPARGLWWDPGAVSLSPGSPSSPPWAESPRWWGMHGQTPPGEALRAGRASFARAQRDPQIPGQTVPAVASLRSGYNQRFLSYLAVCPSLHPSIPPSEGPIQSQAGSGTSGASRSGGAPRWAPFIPTALENGVQSGINAPSCPPPLTAPAPLIPRLSWTSPWDGDGKPEGSATAGRRSHPGPGAACQSGTNPP